MTNMLDRTKATHGTSTEYIVPKMPPQESEKIYVGDPEGEKLLNISGSSLTSGQIYTGSTSAVPKPLYKFNETELMNEFVEYVNSTYKQHYVGEDNVQAMELIASSGHGSGFTMGNIIKYSSRYGKKDGKNRDDVMKMLHYALLALYVHDKENR